MKYRLKRTLKSIAIYSVTALQIMLLSQPVGMPVYAEETVPTEGTSTVSEESAPVSEPEPVCTPPAEVRWPTGSASHTYSYNCDSGLWENAYYTWNPATSAVSARYTPEHRFNSSTGKYEVYEWVYSAPQGSYVYVVTATYAPAPTPAPDTTPAPANNQASQTPSESNESGSAATSSSTPLGLSSSSTGSAPISIITHGSGYMTEVDLNLDADVSTDIDSTSVSGDASVLQNTAGGDASSGDASATANVINMIQSAFGWQGAMPTVYTADIQGDYFGDIIIDPSSFDGIAGVNNCGCDLDVNADIDASIVNNINLLAQSGDSTVSSNTSAGSATTGDASAVANIVNMISSSIAAGESFVGVLNVHGDLEGDVLMADNLVEQLIASNVPTVDIGLCSCDLSADLTANMAIQNDITASAGSGNATVSNNTSAGSATTGNASTNVTVFNLTGRNVVGQDALLVFVNVAGEWVGFITNAPGGATSALLGGGLTTNSVDADIDATTNASIHNNVNVAAYSGDAEVSHNTSAGDASSGDASANVNVANIVNSSFSLGGWFGLLFINIFGDWHGSFGTNTPYGNKAAPVVMPPIPVNSSPASGVVGSAGGPGARRVRAYSVSLGSSGHEDGSSKAVLTSATEIEPNSVPLPEESFGAPTNGNSDYTIVAMFGLLAMAYVIIFRSDWIAAILRRN